MNKHDTCDGCGAQRPKGKQWFYTYPDIVKAGEVAQPIDVRCPVCASPEQRAARSARRSKNLKHRP